MSTTYYKVLGEDGAPCHGGSGKWVLPKGRRPGRWMPKIGEIVPCESGYHVCESRDLVHWLGPTIWRVEIRGEKVRAEDKTVVGEARLLSKCEHWNETNARLFAASCARDVLHLYERQCPNDDRVRKCVEAAEAFARGEIDRVVLAAACAAAWAAAWDVQSKRLATLLRTGKIVQHGDEPKRTA